MDEDSFNIALRKFLRWSALPHNGRLSALYVKARSRAPN
jgi:hypothetical protein